MQAPVAEEPRADIKAVDLISRDHRALALLPELQEAANRLALQFSRICTQQLKMGCKASTDPVEVLPGARLYDFLNSPRFMNGIRLGTCPGAGVITVDGILGGMYVERQFGGDLETPPFIDGAPTETEKRTVTRLAETFIAALSAVMAPISKLDPRIERGEPLILKNNNHVVAVVLFAFHLTIGEHRCTINIALDTSAAGFKLADKITFIREEDSSPLAPALEKVQIQISVILGQASLPIHQFMTMKAGDLITLNTPVNAEIPLLVEGKTKFSGTPAINQGCLSLQIKQKSEE